PSQLGEEEFYRGTFLEDVLMCFWCVTPGTRGWFTFAVWDLKAQVAGPSYVVFRVGGAPLVEEDEIGQGVWGAIGEAFYVVLVRTSAGVCPKQGSKRLAHVCKLPSGACCSIRAVGTGIEQAVFVGRRPALF